MNAIRRWWSSEPRNRRVSARRGRRSKRKAARWTTGWSSGPSRLISKPRVDVVMRILPRTSILDGMPVREMTEADVCRFLNLVDSLGIEIWLDGGWAVDAWLGGQTRPH